VLVEYENTVPCARGRLLLDKPRSGLRVVAWHQYGVVKAECRLAAVLDGDARSYRLAARHELRHADEAMREEVRGLVGAVPEGTLVGVSRYDLTTEREFQAGADGQAVLKAMRALCPPGYVVRRQSRPMASSARSRS
jgi:hypothetical protein